MERAIGEALEQFEAALSRFRSSVGAFPAVSASLFEGTDEWSDLLTYKLVPHLAGEGCLVAAFSGGTNTGKSTVYNLFLGAAVSPVVNTAAATCRPIIAANERRYRECLDSKLVPEFRPISLDNPQDPVDRNSPEDALYVARLDDLPDHLVVMDTPDVDSIDKQHWEVADHIRAAGDVLVAVITAEKYKDERVVAFFREAVESGRVVLPLMNKADEARDFEVARQQLADFCEDVQTTGPCFVVPYNPRLGEDLKGPIRALDGEETLGEHLENFDVPAIKQRVFSTTVQYFADRAGIFLHKVTDLAESLRETTAEFESATHEAALQYDPAPGAAVGGLFHEYVQSKRGPVRRSIGATSAALVRGTSAVSRGVMRAFRSRATLEGEGAENPEVYNQQHRQMIEGIARDLAARHIDRARRAAKPGRTVLIESVDAWDADQAIEAVVREAMRTEDVSESFRQHAHRMLDAWWSDHKGRRRVLESLDIILAVMPAAIAAPIAVHTGGIGASEAAIAVGPVAAQFVTRVMELQFGDAMFDFLSPWKQEQQEALEAALTRHVTEPLLARLHGLVEMLEGEDIEHMGKAQATCLTV